MDFNYEVYRCDRCKRKVQGEDVIANLDYCKKCWTTPESNKYLVSWITHMFQQFGIDSASMRSKFIRDIVRDHFKKQNVKQTT